MTVAVFTFVLLTGNALKEILPLLVSGKVPFGVVAQAVAFLLPFVWVFALPMGMLTATLLTFGRFSADQELTAVRASGISLLSLVSPILLLSLALCVLSALVNMDLGPRSRVAYKDLRLQLTKEFSGALVPERRYIKDFEGYILYADKNRKGALEDVYALDLARETLVHAQRGTLEIDTQKNMLRLWLYNGKVYESGREVTGSFEAAPYEIPMDFEKKGQGKPDYSDMTFLQLWNELRELERLAQWPVSRRLTPTQLAAWKKEWQGRLRESSSHVVFQMHRQVAFSFACFGFTLLGIPLGIRVHRRETNIGIAIALALVSVYYSFILLGQALETSPEWVPHLIVWVPNFLFQAVGAVLLWRANRGV